MGDEEKKQSRADKLRDKAHESLIRTFRAYQEWQLASCRESDHELDPGNGESFIDWVKDEYGIK